MSTRSLNKVMLIGNLTRDPELRYTGGGTSVATFGVATNRNYTDSSGNNIETAEFTNVVAWAKLAEICAQLLKKGAKVYIEGRLQTSAWDDKETGKKMRRTEVVATDMIILSNPAGGASSQNDNSQSDTSAQDNDMNEDVTVDASAFDAEFEKVDDVDSDAQTNDKSGHADDNDATDGKGQKEKDTEVSEKPEETPF